MPIPRPIFITIGASKGGVGKTTVAINLAHHLGTRGYKVLALDLNVMNDLWSDVSRMAAAGIDNPFHIRYESGGSIQQKDLNYSEYQFVVADTAQWIPNTTQLEETRKLWEIAHLLIIPMIEQETQRENLAHSIRQYREIKPNGFFAIFLHMMTPLQAAGYHKEFLQFIRDLHQETQALVPPQIFSAPADLIDHNFNMQFAPWRVVATDDASVTFSERFKSKFNMQMEWLVQSISEICGGLPKPEGSLSALHQLAAQQKAAQSTEAP